MTTTTTTTIKVCGYKEFASEKICGRLSGNHKMQWCPFHPLAPTVEIELPSTTQPASGAGSEWTSVNMTEDPRDPRFTIEQGDKLLATVYDAATAARIISDHEQHSTLTEQRHRLMQAMWELLVEAEVSNVLWQQSRGFVGTVDDAYRKGLMPAAYGRAKQVLTTIEQEGETR